MTPPRHEPSAARQPLRLAAALRERLAEGYRGADLRADLMAGAVVGIVALPLSMALAIASGVPPQYGLYTAIIAGALIALLGGTRTNVSGPTAAFVVVLSPISARFGLSGLVLASFMAGGLMLAMGWLRLGRLIQFIPHPVTTGFTAGIAVVIAMLQVKDLLGLHVAVMPEHFLERLAALVGALPTWRAPDLAVGAGTLLLLVVWPRVTRRVPGPLIALAAAGAAAWALATWAPGLSVDTIATRFSAVADGVLEHGIPRTPPHFVLPWLLPGPDGSPVPLSLNLLRALMGPALAIALLGAIESLLCAVVADGMAGTRHDPDVELVGQGLGNIVAPFFGGFAATGAVARTATAIRAGARSPLASFFHALFVLAAVLALAPALSWLPMAGLAALLIHVAWGMCDARHFAHIVRVAPRSDVAVLLTCFSLTVVFDMVVAVSVGIVLAALLFMREMAEIAGARPLEGEHHHFKDLPPGVIVYEITGPLFFGAAEKAALAIARSGGRGSVRAVVLDMEDVPAMDVTGLVALESAIGKLRGIGITVVLAGVRSQPSSVLRRGGVQPRPGHAEFAADVPAALARLPAG
ncbi:MAG TPA: C4-dicarboxylic acid transporter DauA [Planctomycetota bacterium]|nr:C4-dicarboxylic acid transporter DauA [Planctomycetota bacterium]